jgi:pimeloyl-ACP methyl ester carboxylesterase
MTSAILDKYANQQSRFLVINKALVHYRDEGEGEPFLLLHGAFSSLHTFDGWTTFLKDKYRIIRLDLPGFGLSDTTPDHRYSINTFVKFLAAFLDRLGIERCHLGGSSLGGWLAWEFCLRYPDRVNRLVLIGSAGFLNEQSIPLPFKMARMPFVNRVIRFAVPKGVFEVFLKQVYADPSKITPELKDRYYDLFSREGNPEAFLALVNGKYKDNTLHLKEIQQPTLIIWGEKDRWLSVSNAYEFHKRIPHSELVIYDDLGHIPMEEAPKPTALDAWAFLSRPLEVPNKS